jgi:SAM-dependent methyltransferase
MTNLAPDSAEISELLSQRPAGVIETVSPHDGMYEYAPDLYERAGNEALRNVRLAMLAGMVDTVSSILDFACGYGRVMRVLKAAFPDAALTGTDILPKGVDFCAETFGARGVLSDRDPREIELEGRFDLIWSGSLLTHVPPESWVHFLRLWESVLAPGGVLVFTAYGRGTVESLRTGANLLNLTPEQAGQVIAAYDGTGVGFSENFVDGDCVASKPWVCGQLRAAPSLRLLLYTERGWLGQDAIGCVKAPELAAAA